MKVTKPLQHIKIRENDQEIPCWFFEDVDLGEFDSTKINWVSMKGKNILTESDNYIKRNVASRLENVNNPEFNYFGPIVQDIVKEIRDNHSSLGLEISWPMNTWSNALLDGNPENLHYDLKQDSKGFHMGPHLDNRNTKWTMIMNLKDHISSTVIHTDQGDIKIPTSKGSGVFYFNHDSMLHSIGPTHDEERVTLFWMNMIE